MNRAGPKLNKIGKVAESRAEVKGVVPALIGSYFFLANEFQIVYFVQLVLNSA